MRLGDRTFFQADALRFYEDQGLIRAQRTDSGHRRYPRTVIRLVAFIVFALPPTMIVLHRFGHQA